MITCRYCKRELEESKFGALNLSRCKECLQSYNAGYLRAYYAGRRAEFAERRRRRRAKEGESFKEAARKRQRRYWERNRAKLLAKARERYHAEKARARELASAV